MFSRDEMQRAIEDALKSMEGVALELYRRGREEAREELEEARARNADMRAMLEQVTRERDEALARCETLRELADAAAYEQGLAQRRMMDAQRERDEARAEVERLRTALLEVQTSESAPSWFADGFHDGWKAGAEAMREACAVAAERNAAGWFLVGHLRALPIPEEP